MGASQALASGASAAAVAVSVPPGADDIQYVIATRPCPSSKSAGASRCDGDATQSTQRPGPGPSRLRKGVGAGRRERQAREAARARARATSRGFFAWPPWCTPHGLRRKVFFSERLAVAEYQRLLGGGDAVPADGTTVALGLGRLVQTSWAKLAPPAAFRRTRLHVEESAYVPASLRMKLLRRAMGDAQYFGAWPQFRSEIRKLRRSRSAAMTEDTSHQLLMPTSTAEALTRASDFARASACANLAGKVKVVAARDVAKALSLQQISIAPSPRGCKRKISAELLCLTRP